MHTIGCGVSAAFAAGLLLFTLIAPESAAAPIALAAPQRSSTSDSQVAITTYVHLPLIRHSTGELVVNPQSREESLNIHMDMLFGRRPRGSGQL